VAASTLVRSVSVRLSRQLLERAISRIREGELRVVLPDGRIKRFGAVEATSTVTLKVLDDRFFPHVLLHGEIGFGEAYQNGWFETDDLVQLVALGIINRKYVSLNESVTSAISRIRHQRLQTSKRNTREGSRRNIHWHYDMSNEFFRIWLDETFTYSCALFDSPEQSFEDAQTNKHRVLCEKAGVGPSDHILEIGGGWGAFAEFAARTYGCRVTTITISEEQYPFMKRRMQDAGLDHLVDVQLCDYRDVQGQFDKILSTEVFEHIGAELLASCFEKCDILLKPGGRIVIQVLGVPDRGYEAARTGMHWVQKYIFPGTVTPSIAALERATARTGLLINSIEDIGPRYPETIFRWREKLLANAERIRALGFDERVVRTWDFYLATVEACYRTRHLSDLQVVFEKPRPWTMAYQQRSGEHVLAKA
jgi:cyclopropane-fatty-acyl-phospholipid synthase